MPCQKPWRTRSAHRYPLTLARAVFLIIIQYESKDIICHYGCVIYCMRNHHYDLSALFWVSLIIFSFSCIYVSKHEKTLSAELDKIFGKDEELR